MGIHAAEAANGADRHQLRFVRSGVVGSQRKGKILSRPPTLPGQVSEPAMCPGHAVSMPDGMLPVGCIRAII